MALGVLVLANWLLPAVSGAANAPAASQFRIATDSNAAFPNPAMTAAHDEFIVLQAWESTRALELKSLNPNLKVLVYQNLASMAQGTSATGLSSSGVNLSEATAGHPEWFLLNTRGEHISNAAYPWLWMADIGNRSYQERWTENVLKLLSSGPWSGVLVDDTNTTARYATDPTAIAKYPNDAAYQAAVESMLSYAGPHIQAAGKLAIPNIGSWSEYPEVAARWLQYVSGAMDEMFTKWSSAPGEGYRDNAGWQTQISEAQTAGKLGKYFLAVTQASASDSQAIRYGWASALLGSTGTTSFTAAESYTNEIWSSEYESQIGAPAESASELPSGAWERHFSEGLVLVNPTTSTVSVSLGGSYSGTGLSSATSASMPPHTALILRIEKKIYGESGPEAPSSGVGETRQTPSTSEAGQGGEARSQTPITPTGTPAEGANQASPIAGTEAPASSPGAQAGHELTTSVPTRSGSGRHRRNGASASGPRRTAVSAQSHARRSATARSSRVQRLRRPSRRLHRPLTPTLH